MYFGAWYCLHWLEKVTYLRRVYYAIMLLDISFKGAHYSFICIIKFYIMKILYNEDIGRTRTHTKFQDD